MLNELFATLPADFVWWSLIVLIAAGFAAGYIDAIAGGGGMIQALALLMAGVPPVATLATNKVVSMCGTTTAVIKYTRGRAINWHLAAACILPCLLASALGSRLVMLLNTTLVNWLIILCIPVALAMVFIRPKKQANNKENPSRGSAIALLTPIGFYDGLLGPGTGTYMAIAANKYLNMRFLRATGLAKPLNLATNIGAAVMFIVAGQVLWVIALPMAAASVLGAYWGSHSAIARGDDFIKKIMLIMLLVMLLVNIGKLVL